MSKIKELSEKIQGNMTELETLKKNAEKEVRNLSAEELVHFNQVMQAVEADMTELETEKRFEDAAKRISKPTSTPAESTIPVPKTEFRSFGDYLQSVAQAGVPSSIPDPRLKRVASGLSEGTPADGGFLIPPQYAPQLWKRVYETGQVASRCTRIPVQSMTFRMNCIDESDRATGSRLGGVRAYWIAEAGVFTKSKPLFRQIELSPKKLGCLVYATEENLDDAGQLQSIVEQSVAEELAFTLDDAIINGTTNPTGILNAAARVDVSRTTASHIKHNDIINMWPTLWARSQTNAVWFANTEIFPELATMSINASGYAPVWMPNGGVAGSPYQTLMGRPVIYIEQAAALGTTGDLMFCDMSQYLLIDRSGINAASSMHVQFLYDEMVFRFIMRVNGIPIWNLPLTPYKGSNTVTPFVALT